MSKHKEEAKKKKVKVSRPEKFLSSIFGRRPGKVSFAQKLFASKSVAQPKTAEKKPTTPKKDPNESIITCTVHVRDDLGEYANEREIKRVGTQGVVQLFNAVTKYRKESLETKNQTTTPAEKPFKFKK